MADDFFTLVFEGDLRKVPNPHATDTPFGRAVVAGIGNAFAEFDAFVEARDELLDALRLILPLAKGYAPDGQTDQAKRTCRSWIEAAEAAVARALAVNPDAGRD